MSEAVFRFKQFNIAQDHCSMKVGTDGVLLGAWTVIEGPEQILDIGTGTGLIAMMLAQRCSTANIDAIEVAEDSFLQAGLNFKACKWNNRLNAINVSFQNFYAHTGKRYDLVVVNPPYFINSYKSSTSGRNMARHTDSLPFAELTKGVQKILNPNGVFCVILPKTEGEHFIELAESEGLFCSKLTRVKPTAEKSEKRLLMEFRRNKQMLTESELVIEKEQRHCYTNEYIELTKDFYLNF